MNAESETLETRPCWFVGAWWDGEDQVDRFLEEGIWENGYDDKYLDLVRSIKPGDRIAIKSASRKKYGFDFDTRGHYVAFMNIKATGTVTRNHDDGKIVEVVWDPVTEKREWLFHTNWSTIWKVMPGSAFGDALIAFTFDGKEQDIEWFRNHPFWKDRFGDIKEQDIRFQWTSFFEELADRLLAYENNRGPLLEKVFDIAEVTKAINHIYKDKFSNGSTGPIKDICPFTIIGLFNRGQASEKKRRDIAKELADFLKIEEPVPESFEGLPVLSAFNSLVFPVEKHRKPGDIDTLWRLFREAIAFVDTESYDERDFIHAYDDTLKISNIKWNITIGLYWIRPWDMMPLDERTRRYITKELKLEIRKNGPSANCSGYDYVELRDTLNNKFMEPDYPVKTFPELTFAAYHYIPEENPPEEGQPGDIEPHDDSLYEYVQRVIKAIPLHFSAATISNYLLALQTKRFVILSGMSGTGKTRLAIDTAKAILQHRLGHLDAQETYYQVVPVRPDWTDHRAMLGYYNPLTSTYIETPVLRLLLHAMEHSDHPHFLILDEMNLARVEHYFSDFLSGMESGETIPLHTSDQELVDSESGRVIPRELDIPENVFVTGTVNIDETTYMFSPKVIDRAFVMELNEVDLRALGQEQISDAETLELSQLEKIQSPKALNKTNSWEPFEQLAEGKFLNMLIDLQQKLDDAGKSFAYRVALEIARFMVLANEQSDGSTESLWTAFDMALLQKVVAKFHGTSDELSKPIDTMLEFVNKLNGSNVAASQGTPEPKADSSSTEEDETATSAEQAENLAESDIQYLPRTKRKLESMKTKLKTQGYVSYLQ